MTALYAYINRPTRTVLLHVPQCPSCNRGLGIHKGTPESKELLGNGMWAELPSNLDRLSATRFVRNVLAPAVFGGSRWVVRPCRRCSTEQW